MPWLSERIVALARRWVFLLFLLLTSLTAFGCEGDDDQSEPIQDLDATIAFDVSNDRNSGSTDAATDNVLVPTDTGIDTAIDAEAGPTTFTVGGTVTGLAGATGLVLQLNGANNLPIAADGPFTFTPKLTNGSSYSVTVGAQPATKICSVSANFGTIQNANVASVVVNCSANAFTVGGTISGLAQGASVTLLNNGTTLTRSVNGQFVFPTTVTTGQNYAVTVSGQPAGPTQICTVTNGTGLMGNGNVANVVVTCVTQSFTVGGNLTGLAGGNVVLQNNAGNNLTLSQNGQFTFTQSVLSGAAFKVTVLNNPTTPTQVCTVTNGTGTMGGANFTTVDVTCVTSKFKVGGTLSGLNAGNTIVLRNNGVDDLTLNLDGTFQFATSIASGAPYNVTVFTQPNMQQCNVSAGVGTVGSGPVATVTVNCGNTYTVGGTVTGLGAGTLILRNNGAFDSVNIGQDGNFAFPKPLVDLAPYAVTVGTQPSSPTQDCQITNGSGNIAGANVQNVTVVCTTSSFKVGGVVSGLAANQSVQLSNGADTITVGINGDFVFPTSVLSGTGYLVSVAQQPLAPIKQTCTVTNESGIVGANDVTNVLVSCKADTFSIGGDLTGLANGAQLVIQNNGGDNLTLTNVGPFTFNTKLASGTSYNVTVLTDPLVPSQKCTVSAGVGPVTNANIATIAINCTTNSFKVGGTVTGMDTTNGNVVVLQNNAGDDITVDGNKAFEFPIPVVSGMPYAVTVKTDPTNPAQTCSVNAGSGTMGGGAVNSVVVNCSTNTYTIGGKVAGLAGGNKVVLRNNGGNDLDVTNNGDFAFTTPIASGQMYSVTVFTSPTAPISQTCTVVAGTGSGTVQNIPITTVRIDCTTNTFKVGGTLSGLAAGNSIVLRNNGGDDLTLNGDGPFTFNTQIQSGNTFIVSAVNPLRPIQQTCTVTAGTGTIFNADYAGAIVSCTIDEFKVSGTLFGLAGGTIILQNNLNAADQVTRTTNGAFEFTVKVKNGSPYSVTIFQQPSGQQQICSVVDGAATMPANDVTNVSVYCGLTCKSIHAASPNLPSGDYTIDPDGSGPIAQITAYCDMSFDGGGWTLAQAINGGLGPEQCTAGTVSQNSCKYMPVNVVAALANLSTNVHIRTPAQAPSIWITSTASSVPVNNLRIARVLNFGVPQGGGANYIGRSYWTQSNNAPTNDLSMFDYSCDISTKSSWPNVFWACGNNTTGLQIVSTTAKWQSQEQSNGDKELYAR